MDDRRIFRTASALGAALVAGFAVAPVAHAGDWALNGKYLAMSNGEWAQTNEVYRDETVVRSIWSIAMTCTNDIICSGRVDSDAGWSADIRTAASEYVVRIDRPHWEPCGDGRTETGHQQYRFYPVAPDGFLLPGSDVFAGIDTTMGRSGGCSINDTLRIEMPLRLEKLS